MKVKRLILTGVILFAFLFTNVYTGNFFYGTGLNSTVYAAENNSSGQYTLLSTKSSRSTSSGIRSGSFKSSSSGSSTGGYKSGTFKSSGSTKSSGSGSSNYKSGDFSKSKSASSYSSSSSSRRTYVPIPIPWGGFHPFGYGGVRVFHPISSIFKIIIIIFVIYLILKIINKRRH
jgi:hypothetical protein